MKRIKGQHKVLIIFLLVFFTTAVGYSQTMIQREPSEELKEVAKETTEMWTRELVLSPKQAELMKDKIIEFAMKKDRVIQSKMREEVKTESLKALQIEEHQEIRDILTKPQFEKYLAITENRIKDLQNPQKN